MSCDHCYIEQNRIGTPHLNISFLGRPQCKFNFIIQHCFSNKICTHFITCLDCILEWSQRLFLCGHTKKYHSKHRHMWTWLLKVDHSAEEHPVLKESYPEKHGVNQASKRKATPTTECYAHVNVTNSCSHTPYYIINYPEHIMRKNQTKKHRPHTIIYQLP